LYDQDLIRPAGVTEIAAHPVPPPVYEYLKYVTQATMTVFVVSSGSGIVTMQALLTEYL
jgi:hypothetical protein